MAGPPVLIYLLLARAPAPTVRATLLSFFGIVYAAALLSRAALSASQPAPGLGRAS